jgi:hypothetical protein
MKRARSSRRCEVVAPRERSAAARRPTVASANSREQAAPTSGRSAIKVSPSHELRTRPPEEVVMQPSTPRWELSGSSLRGDFASPLKCCIHPRNKVGLAHQAQPVPARCGHHHARSVVTPRVASGNQHDDEKGVPLHHSECNRNAPSRFIRPPPIWIRESKTEYRTRAGSRTVEDVIKTVHEIGSGTSFHTFVGSRPSSWCMSARHPARDHAARFPLSSSLGCSSRGWISNVM